MVNTTAGAYLFSHGLSVNAQGSRKRIVVGNNEIRTVDIHAHCVFREVADLISGTSMNRGFPDWYLLSPERLGPMDERGIDVAALSVNNFWWYEADTDLAQEIVTIHDEGLAEFCQSHPDRFVFLTSPALQFPELAAEQLEYAVTELGARGASIGGTVLGETNSSCRIRGAYIYASHRFCIFVKTGWITCPSWTGKYHWQSSRNNLLSQ
jgi:aminocarboxymuconate-semialdehyde decarboxylase